MTRYSPAGAFVPVGLNPNSAFLRGSLELDRWGFVVTDEAFLTSTPGIFAAGDVRAGSTKQLAAAVGEGAAALLAIRRYLDERASATELRAAG